MHITIATQQLSFEKKVSEIGYKLKSDSMGAQHGSYNGPKKDILAVYVKLTEQASSGDSMS